MPKASALRFHQSNGSRPNGAPLALRKHSRVLRHRRAPADCFGANPVASALGNPTRRDPGGVMRTYHEGRPAALNTGTFYFGGNRNFLLWSDTCCGGGQLDRRAASECLYYSLVESRTSRVPIKERS